MAMKIWSPRSPTSWTVTMLGCDRRAIAWASRSRRVRPLSSSRVASPRSTLIGDLAVELVVVGGVDDAHAALAEPVEDGEAADLDRRPLAAKQLGLEQVTGAAVDLVRLGRAAAARTVAVAEHRRGQQRRDGLVVRRGGPRPVEFRGQRRDASCRAAGPAYGSGPAPARAPAGAHRTRGWSRRGRAHAVPRSWPLSGVHASWGSSDARRRINCGDGAMAAMVGRRSRHRKRSTTCYAA